MKSKSLFNSSKWRVGNPLFDELRAQKYVQIRKICPKFCIFNRRKSVENELCRCLIGAINRHFPTPKWPDLPCFLAKGSRKSFAGQISGRATVAPVKNDDFGGVFHPLAGKLFSVTKSISRNGKHSLPGPKHIMFLPLTTGRISRPVPACSPTNLKRRTARPRSRHREQKRSKKEGRRASYSTAGCLIQKDRLTD